MKKRESGFSILELVIVVAIALIVTAIAVPSFKQVLDNYRLSASGHDVASVLRQAQMAAVQTNQPYYVQINAGPPNTVTALPASRLVPPTPLPGDPTAVTASNVAFQAVGLPNTAQLDAFVGGAPAPVGGVIAFNARGMPCVQAASPWICTPGAAGFEWFMQSSTTGSWEAITVTPAGRIRSWRLTSAIAWQ